MSDRIAVKHSLALHMAADSGVLNELNAQDIYNDMLDELDQPVSGYFYADDVSDLLGRNVKNLIDWSEEK